MRSRIMLALTVMLWAVPASAVPILSVNPVSGAATVGGNTTFDIVVADAEDLYAFQFDLSFDPTIIQVATVLEGAFLATGGSTFCLPGDIDNVAGTLSFLGNSLIGDIPGVFGAGILARVTFTALAAGTSTIDLLNAIVLDSTLAEVTSITNGGSLTVTAGGGGGGSERVPEPGTLALLAIGGLAMFGVRRRRPAIQAA